MRAEIEALLDRIGWAWDGGLSLPLDWAVVLEGTISS